MAAEDGGGTGRERGGLAEALQYAQAGTLLISPMVLFGAIGLYLDRRFGTRPWLLLGGLLIGMLGGFVSFFRLVLPGHERRGGGGAS